MFDGKHKSLARLRCQPLELKAPPEALFEALFEQEQPALLESSALHPDYGRYSIMAANPAEVLTLREGVLTNRRGEVLAQGAVELWAALAGAFGAITLRETDPPVPYAPGWIGYVGYEVGRQIERLPGQARRDTRLPDLRLAFYDALLIHDAIERRWWLTELEFDRRPPWTGRAAAALRRIAERPARDEVSSPHVEDSLDAAALPQAQAHSNFTREQYLHAVRRCVDYIAAGDIFQVNLSQRFVIDDAPPPDAIYRALRRRNPAWYAAFLRFASAGRTCAVLSSSPELFLRLRGDAVLTRPIKGTRPRVGQAAADAAAKAELLVSPKDNAELAMIIDLLRNDLGRVSRYGSVAVTEPRRLEAHPTVFHLVGTVQGCLRHGVGQADLLRATFPGGSITGAPKIRAMEIIDELEDVARGVYTGCIGIVGVDGNCEWNIAIRTIVCEGNRAFIQVGGGIVAESDPASEYRETLDKARAMLEAVAQAQAACAGRPALTEAGRR
jgi:para-aminobenzoate synthetase component 1